MLEGEDNKPTFDHPQNWNELRDQEKADLIVITNMIKLICTADLSSHYFKEVSSLSKTVKQVLNNDSRLDINAPKEDRPSLDNVLQEIQKTRTRVNKHQNSQKDSFKKILLMISQYLVSQQTEIVSYYLSKVSPYHLIQGKGHCGHQPLVYM